MVTVPPRVVELVETFERNIEAYKNQQYNEAQLRREFIDPFFEELGWDITNKGGLAQAYKDVIHEDAIKIGGYTKAPDYCFRIGGTRKFFLEAKKPSIDIKGDPHPAYQLRRYAWSAKLPLSILTDFEEFAVYDCQIRPKQTDKASTARIRYWKYKEYIEKWDEIADIFSKDKILKGSFDKFVVSPKGKRGTTTVDNEFLKEIEEWRKMLARTITLLNIKLSKHDINFAVQRTIDRILFLRMCEDRGIERYQQLLGVTNGRQIYPRLCQVFKQADARYNSGLFHFRKEPGRAEEPDELTLNLIIDDTPVSWIIRSLYYPKCPYEFSVLPAEILGNVYEQFLGKIIRITPGHRAVIEEKPEVKKSGGIYYTPAYIVDYIVKNTVGKLLGDPNTRMFSPQVYPGGSPKNRKSLTPKQVENLRILDPACGSGSFLLSAYTYLLNYHRDWYVENDPKKYTKQIYQGRGGQWFLTIAEKKKILLNNIFGVDIDSQAVEVTKLSLLLKVLEDESAETVGQTYKMFHERALPDLGNNIKCGNSLIGPDFYEDKDPDSFDEEQRRKINPFDYKTEFPQVFSGKNLGAKQRSAEASAKADGFHAVIGNPPYVRQETLGEFKEYFQNHYKVYHGIADLYTYFIEKGVSLLNKGGRFGYIVANKWMRANYGEPLRRWLKQQRLEHILDFGDLRVFKSATTYPCIITVSKNAPATHFLVTQIKTLDFLNLSEYTEQHAYPVKQTSLDSKVWPLTNESTQQLLQKLIEVGVPLEKYVNGKIFRGVLTGLNKAFVIDAQTRDTLIKKDPKNAELIKPFLMGRNIKRYVPTKPERFLIFMPKGWTREKSGEVKNAWRWLKDTYPTIANHLAPHQAAAEDRCDKGEYWWELRACAYYDEFEKPKIMLPDISLRGNFTLDETGNMYCVNTSYIVGAADKYLLGILNSSLITFFYKNLSPSYRGGYLRFIYQYLIEMPIKTTDFDNPDDKARHNKMVKLVDRMLDLHKKQAKAKVPAEKTRIQRQINTTDKQIDKLVYDLYGLTEEEITIIEKA